MEEQYLLDTNIIIYHLNGISQASIFIDKNFKRISISFITYIDVLSYPFDNNEVETEVKHFLNQLKMISIDTKIIEKSIEIRKKSKIKIPDAIIAATASVENLILVTRNIKDFKSVKIKTLNIMD